MLKASLSLTCDSCGEKFPCCTTAAENAGWIIFNDLEQRLCPSCSNDYWDYVQQQAPPD